MMNDSVAECGLVDFSCFWIAENEGDERLWCVCLGYSFVLNFFQIFRQILFKFQYIEFCCFSFSRFFKCIFKIFV